MPTFYLDTSAVLKRYRTEKGTDVVTELYEGAAPTDILVTSYFTCLEIESVTARALKGRLLTHEAHDVLLGTFSQDVGDYLLLLSFDSGLINEAIDAARRLALRPADAIHFAAAQEGNRRVTGGEYVFVASDKELLAATEAAGMTILDPEANGAIAQLRKLRGHEPTRP